MDVKCCKKKRATLFESDPTNLKFFEDPCNAHLKCNPRCPPQRDCPDPYICMERLLNPDPEQKNELCDLTPFLPVMKCGKSKKPPHPCDGIPYCNDPAYLERQEHGVCKIALCYDRIKNPDEENMKKRPEECIP